MPPFWLSSTVAALGVLGSLIWIGLFVSAARNRREIRRLANQTDELGGGEWPALSVLFSARDEQAHVERATRSMLAMDYPNLRVVAVDDRSVDETGAILDRLAREDSRLTVVHVRDLPEGWLGKTHALQLASEATDAPWLLFTDADVHFAPRALRKAVAYAIFQRADLVIVPPDVPTEGFGERLFLVMFQLSFTLYAPGWKVENERKKTSVGVGAFNLVRAEPFRDIGGFRRLALSVDDDLQLGRALKWAGYRPRVLLGEGEVSVRWQIGLGGMIRGLEKNFFALVDYNLIKAFFASMALLVASVGPFLGLFLGPLWTRLICMLGVLVIAVLTALVRGMSRFNFLYGLLAWLSGLILFWTLWRSVVLTLARGGVRWRGHLYPLARLRQHVTLRERWMRELWASTRS